MPYIVCKHPGIRMDIMVRRQYWADVVGMIERTGCTYWREDHVEPVKDEPYVILRDIQAKKDHQLGEFLGLLYGLEWKAVTEPEIRDVPRKFYILLRQRKGKKEKRHAEEVREEIRPGSESGDRGEPAGDIQPGEAAGDCGDGPCPDWSGTDDVFREDAEGADDCRQ